ncbi:MAG: P27 family phage terminase small subunit [Rhodobacteraceae bacterium]|nr:MAG: P27 family phage terminase small subunit [Paracoccaceae bacterium]
MKGTKPHIKLERDVLPDMAAPDFMGPDAAAEWDRVYPLLVERKILTRADLGILENYCEAIGLAREMGREIRKLGAVQLIYALDKECNSRVISSRKNPACSVQADATNRARLMASELGLTPVSRSRPTVSNEDDQDDLFNF